MRYAQVQVAEHVLVHEVEPVPAVDVAQRGQRDDPVAVDEVEGRGMALGGVGEAGEDVPRSGDDEEGFERFPWVKVADALDGATPAAREDEIDEDDSDGEDDADEALGEDVESAG